MMNNKRICKHKPTSRICHWLQYLVVVILLILGGIYTTEYTAAQGSIQADPVPITDKELVHNGTFDLFGQYNKPLRWVSIGTGSGVDQTGGPDSSPAMAIEGIMENQAHLYQELYLPTEITAAQLSFDYRLVLLNSVTTAAFYVNIITQTNVITSVLARGITSDDTGWLHVDATLNTSDIAKINAAHTAGDHVYLIFDLYQEPASVFKALVDNVSMTINGSMTYPALTGTIAYVGWDDAGNMKSVNTIQPDGEQQQTLWEYPGSVPDTNKIYDVAWKPDATELAFSSNHESLYSAFHADIYGIQPDKSGLRRITNPPSKATLEAGTYGIGKVTGTIYNDYGNLVNLFLYIEGATQTLSIPATARYDEVSFSLDVADLGPDSHYAVLTWSDSTDANCKDYPAAVIHVTAGQTTDVRRITFNPATCNSHNVQSISWKRDGSEVGFFVESLPRKVPVTGQALGTELFASGTVFASGLAWSPQNDQILYQRSTFDANSGIYLTTVSGGIGTHVVSDFMGGLRALYVTPAWLPDGSGFVYTLDHYLYQYTLASSEVITLAYFNNEYVFNPSVSPDGQYVVFEWQVPTIPPQRDLWILNRLNPAELWPVTTDGKSGNPDWSQTTPGTVCTPVSEVGVQGPTSASSGTAVTLNAVYTPTNASGIALLWDNGKTGTSTSYTWNTTGDHTVTITATDACGTTPVIATHTVNVTADCTPLTDLGIQGPTTAPSGTAVTLNAVYTPSTASGVTLLWDNGATGANTSYTWITGTYTVTLTGTATCGPQLTTQHTVVVRPAYRVYLPLILKLP